MKLIVLYCAVCALLLGTVTAKALVEKDAQVEKSTESPIADMALVDTKVGDMQTAPVKAQAMNTSDKEKLISDSQQHTIADFIIHPLIALKPHVAEGEGKQADTSSTTPSPWQLFGFNSGQGLGSQVSSLAGSVTGWLGNRIQFPGLVDTPVRESTTTSTTTTTPKPDVVVRVKQRGSTKKPLISIRGDDERPYRKTKRPIKYNNWEDEDDEDFDDEEEEDEEVYNNNKRYQNNNNRDDDDEEEDDDNEDSDVNNNNNDDEDEDNEVEYNSDDEQADEEEEEEEPPKPVKQNQRRRHPRPLNNRRRVNYNQNNNQRRRFNNNNKHSNTARKQQQQHRKPYQESEEVEQDEEDDEEAEPEAESEQQQDFYYNKNPSSKRSQTEQSFIQRGQETLIKQIQQFTGGQTPAEVSQTLRKNKKSGNKKQRNQGTLIIKRNGQAVYVAPELLQVTDASPAGQHISVTSNQVKKTSHYPQPPLTVPYKRKGKPAQYITIPWSQLGISPPDDLTALTNGVQTQPLILNIPQSAIDSMQYPKVDKRKQVITPDSVPLLADASIMDIFKPPRIPPARTPTTTKPFKKVPAQNYGPVLIATRTGPTRIRPATIVEKAPADENTDEKVTSEEALEDGASQQLIVIGDESGERQLTHNEYRKILDFFNQRAGRQLNDQEEQLIPVKVIAAEDNITTEGNKIDDKIETKIVHDSLKQESGMDVEVENVTEIPVDNGLKHENDMEIENATETPVDSSLNRESGVEMEMENTTEIPIDNSLKQESPVDDVTESVVENATESPVNV